MLLAALATLATSPDPSSYVVDGRRHGHRHSVRLGQRKFDEAGRKIRMGTMNPPRWTRIDGRRPWGQEYDPELPSRELASFQVRVDGKSIRVLRSLGWDCFENGRRLAVKMRGSDGGGGYCVLWRLGPGQPARREIYTDSTVLMEIRSEKRYQWVEARIPADVAWARRR